ncbi:hypothetical protein DFP72DRAFT_892882 [Ephemerocybe angulata]|uniref:Uncharacterized protein n=1 Tax=Ephemerocybe angulata TaxID=980116 RepID=A0A8H6M9G0_9AGAR|nr:hypothetical protein DFP72DRAFT_892882 [Tulosesus angulatus]
MRMPNDRVYIPIAAALSLDSGHNPRRASIRIWTFHWEASRCSPVYARASWPPTNPESPVQVSDIENHIKELHSLSSIMYRLTLSSIFAATFLAFVVLNPVEALVPPSRSLRSVKVPLKDDQIYTLATEVEDRSLTGRDPGNTYDVRVTRRSSAPSLQDDNIYTYAKEEA